jgi:predicted aspartyl protease
MSIRIEWRHDRRRIILPVLVLRPTPSRDLSGYEARALLDTGATTSGITPRVARNLDLPPRGKRPLGSARGEEQAERYLFRIGLMTVPRGGAPSFPFLFDDVVGFELRDNFHLDMLLGMDVLSQCDFSMDRSGICLLTAG